MHTYGLCGHDITVYSIYTRWGVHVSALSFCVTFISYTHRIHIIYTHYIYAVDTILYYIEQYERKHEYGRSLFG